MTMRVVMTWQVALMEVQLGNVEKGTFLVESIVRRSVPPYLPPPPPLPPSPPVAAAAAAISPRSILSMWLLL